ncbi:T9SS type A sorting domain-containing protein [Longitalea arenae]|uniref:T9SS type A sorting domain-containing protein n=1 Tax=Longitalea arenae TaxID=2812558 RepID=UPI00196720A4|nr:T9SS type A sorting domain-containing protein [Longitalea arenae]
MAFAQRVLLSFVLLFFVAAYNLHAQTTWTGNVDTDWNRADNWTADVPNATSHVIIPDVTNDPVISSATAAVNSVQIDSGALLTISTSGILTIHEGANRLGFDNLGTVQNDGVITFLSNATVGNGIRNQGVFNNSSGAIITIGARVSGTGLYNLRGTFSNAGTINIGTTTGYVTTGLRNDGAFENLTGANINIGQVNTALYNYSGSFSNAGSISMDIGMSNGGFHNNASFNNNAGGFITYNCIVSSFRNTGTFQNQGTITIGSKYGFSAFLENYGPFDNNTGGIINIDRKNFGIALDHRSSTFTNAGTIAIGANAPTALISLRNEAIFNNTADGLITIDHPYQSSGIGIANTGISFTNAGTIRVGSLGGGNTFDEGIFSQRNFNNTGQINIDRASSALAVGNNMLNNTGTITVGAVAGVATLLSSAGTGTFSNSSGGTLKGTGSIDAARFANNSGSLAPGTSIGVMTFTGDETFGYSTLSIEVNGAGVAGTDFDQLVVNGAATLSGALALSINYTPAVGDRVVILSSTSLSGTFSVVTGLPANWNVLYENNTVVLAYGSPSIPAPATTWTGAVNTNWNIAGNWTAGVPAAALDAFIPDVVNDPVISATAGWAKSVTVQPGGSLTIAATGSLTLQGDFGRGLVNQGTVQNNGVFTIGNMSALGASGIYNEAIFNNNAGAQIKIDRAAASEAALSNVSGVFTNAGAITIGVNAPSGQYGINNTATFSNTGQVNIDQVTSIAIYNYAGTFSNAGDITIGANAASGVSGIKNYSTFNNNAGGQINIDQVTTIAIHNMANTFTNAGAITIGANAAAGADGLQNSGIFNNNTGGQIRIDRVTSAGIYHNGAGFTNAGAITMGSLSAGNTIGYGIYSDNDFSNTGGQINIDRVNTAITANRNFFNNSGAITIGASSSVPILLSNTGGGTFSNNTGGVFKGTGIIAADRYANAGGTLSPGASIGIMTFDYRETFSNGTLSIDVNGTGVAGTDFDQVKVIVTATLGGTLALSINYTPVIGDRVVILTANSIAGAFNTITGLPTNCQIIYEDKSVVLVCTSNPPTTWTGAVNTDWNTAGNWTAGVPTATLDAVIPDVVNDPIISATAGVAKSVTVMPEGSLTIANTGSLTINGDLGQGIINKGTVQNNGIITIGNVSVLAMNGIRNEANFNNNAGAQINIDRAAAREAAINNAVGVFTNAGVITIGANAVAGQYGIYNNASFNNTTGGKLIIDQVTMVGLFNNVNKTVTNAGAITIGATAGTGPRGVENYGVINNNTGGQINIDRTTSVALYNYQGSTFTNAAGIIIGANAASGQYGIINSSLNNGVANFTNSSGGNIIIDQVSTAGIRNTSGNTFNNAGDITIGATEAAGQYGINNSGTFNHTGGQINIDRATAVALYNDYESRFTSAGGITIGASAASGQYGLQNYSLFYNNAGSLIRINRVTITAIYNLGHFDNAATITIGGSAAIPGLLISTGSYTFSNITGGILKGAGSITAARYENAGGTLAPGAPIGVMTFDADETFNNNTLSIDVNGKGVAGTDFDQLVVNGTATLGGTLAVTMNYTPAIGDQVTILSANAVSGTFATVTGLPSYWKVIYTGNAVILEYEGVYTWTGNVSPAWNTAGNWANGTVPGAGKNVLFPATGVVRELTVNNSISTGSIEIATGRTVTIGATGTFSATGTLINNGTIKGAGAIVNANFTNTGILAPGNSLGILSVTGNLINQGVLQAEIGGTTAGTQYDQLAVSGAVTVGGTLTVSTINGFTLAAGQTFTFITGATVTGSFASVTWPAGVTGTVTYLSNAVTLNVLSALPLTLLEFTGQAAGNKAVLKWKTADEENTSMFQIERSADGVSFIKLDALAAMGSGAHPYSFTDENPLAGNNYYRLKMVDIDGQFTYSKTALLKFAAKDGLQITPVPANSFVTLTIKDPALIGRQAQVYNTAGMLVDNVVLTNNTRINIGNWPAGIYNVKTSLGTYRFVKQ